jgi:Domain of unknown function (DUF4266)
MLKPNVVTDSKLQFWAGGRPRKRKCARLGTVAVVLATMALGGCAALHPVRVHPWERAVLADPLMNPDRSPVASRMAEHVVDSREAAQGGRGVGGAGCSCN